MIYYSVNTEWIAFGPNQSSYLVTNHKDDMYWHVDLLGGLVVSEVRPS